MVRPFLILLQSSRYFYLINNLKSIENFPEQSLHHINRIEFILFLHHSRHSICRHLTLWWTLFLLLTINTFKRVSVGSKNSFASSEYVCCGEVWPRWFWTRTWTKRKLGGCFDWLYWGTLEKKPWCIPSWYVPLELAHISNILDEVVVGLETWFMYNNKYRMSTRRFHHILPQCWKKKVHW